MEIYKITFAQLIKLLICFVLLVSMPAAAAAEDEEQSEDKKNQEEVTPAEEPEDICDISTIDKVFEVYKQQKESWQIKKIQQQLKVRGFAPGDIDGKTGPQTDSALARLCVDFKVDEFFKAEESKGLMDPTKHLAEHLVKLLSGPVPIHLSGDNCGCSRDFSAMVYGFYPYLLLAHGEEQVVDYSLLERIGFSALVLDDAGNIQDRKQWSNAYNSGKNIARFINEAHKHRVKVDVTFNASNLTKWNENEIDNAVKNIVETADQKFHSSGVNFWRRAFPLVEDISTVSADGVNLYFDYKAISGSNDRLSEIVTKVYERLKQSGSSAQLNIMLDLNLNRLDSDEQKFPDLKNILVGDAAAVEKVLIFLPKNTGQTDDSKKYTSKSKKKLRQMIEDAFSGDSRRIVLRKIVPIITLAEVDFEPLPANKDGETQFDDDLVYLKDNFAGVGLWPLPLESRSDAEKISKALIKHYQENDGLNYLGEKLEDYSPGLCKFVCPNRVFFYVGLELLVGVLLIYALLALWNCRLREIYKQKFLYFLALFILIPLILLISLICDPKAEKYVDWVVISIMLLFIVGFVWRNVRKAVRPKLP